MYIIASLIQVSDDPPSPVQLIEMGWHWNRLAKKNEIVHIATMATMVQIVARNRPALAVPRKILESSSIH